eukprot:1279647-Rhodomonas_salina.2
MKALTIKALTIKALAPMTIKALAPMTIKALAPIRSPFKPEPISIARKHLQCHAYATEADAWIRFRGYLARGPRRVTASDPGRCLCWRRTPAGAVQTNGYVRTISAGR